MYSKKRCGNRFCIGAGGGPRYREKSVRSAALVCGCVGVLERGGGLYGGGTVGGVDDGKKVYFPPLSRRGIRKALAQNLCQDSQRVSREKKTVISGKIFTIFPPFARRDF